MRSGIPFMAIMMLGLLGCQESRKDSTAAAGEKAYEKAMLDSYYKRLLADPATGSIPPKIHARELAFAGQLPVFYGLKRGEDIWKARGPNNQGGRTRALRIDVKNPDVLIAGSVTGGLWRSTDAGKNWNRTQSPALAITCLVQDTREGKNHIWYAGTGELSGSSGTAPGAYYYGSGILKSTDNGLSWSVLPSTAGISQMAFDTDFDGVWNLAIDVSNTSEDEIYAATYGGIYKSTDGGVSWRKKRSGIAGIYSYYTDVAVTSSGIVYATLSSESSQKGIWRSIDGETWTSITPPGFPSAFGRMCIGIAPSDEKQVWIVATGTSNAGYKSTDFLGRVEWNSLWKYDYVSGNGSGTGGRWTNRSAQIPDMGGDFGYYNTQGGYDLYIKVKPNDTNTVFIGATNLWRSSDAFRSRSAISWIGGYAVNTTRPDFQLYKNHHPDNHELIFVPGSPDKAFSAHDGGISFTSGISAADVSWEDCNAGYISSQFYTIAIDRSLPGDQKLIGGLQDNGTMFMDMYGMGNWQLSFNGDGSYCSFKNGSREVVASAQQGRIARLELDAIGKPLKYARIDPAVLNRSSYDFINPFVLDPHDQKIMYLPAKNRLFRNLNIDAKPLGTSFDSTRWNTPLWEELNACAPPAGSEISAISISESAPNTLYYATDKGRLFRIRNANAAAPFAEDITPLNFSKGNINCIATDPADSMNITVVFSNYGIISLFNSSDGGSNWNNISGNLEENANGSGSGPSCRWAAVSTLADGNKCWFVGTSVGLFATDTLNGAQTRWIRQSPGGIGNSIVTMISSRPQDHYLAVATHGYGVFSANIASSWQITSVPALRKDSQGFHLFPNPAASGRVQLISRSALQAEAGLTLYSLDGKKIALPKAIQEGSHILTTDLPVLPAGIYILQLKNGLEITRRRIVLTGL